MQSQYYAALNTDKSFPHMAAVSSVTHCHHGFRTNTKYLAHWTVDDFGE